MRNGQMADIPDIFRPTGRPAGPRRPSATAPLPRVGEGGVRTDPALEMRLPDPG
jgi:hypothetical protein